MLFLFCGFISQDNLIPFRLLAGNRVLRVKPLKAKSLEFTRSQGYIWVTEGTNLIQEPGEKLGSIRHPHLSCVSQDSLDQSPNDLSRRCLWPTQMELLLVCFEVFFWGKRRCLFSIKLQDSTNCKSLSKGTLEGSTLGSSWREFPFWLTAPVEVGHRPVLPVSLCSNPDSWMY